MKASSLLAALLLIVGCQSQDSASREAHTVPLPSANAKSAQPTATSSALQGGGVGDASSLAPAPVASSAAESAGSAATPAGSSALVAAGKKCPDRPAIQRCATCAQPRCVDGKWVDEPAPEKQCPSKPPGGPCAGAIGFCPVWKCVDGKWVDQRPSKKSPGAPGDPLAPPM